MNKIGIFGGSFNPIHMGHLLIAQSALENCDLRKVFFIPVYTPPHKENKVLPAEDRVEMIKMAIEDNPAFDLELLEIRRKGISYTIDTVRELDSRYKGLNKLILIIGTDSLLEFTTWKDYTILLEMCEIAVVPRLDFKTDRIPSELHNKYKLLNMPEFNISSTQIRNRILSGKDIKYMVPDKVREYIINKKLYSI